MWPVKPSCPAGPSTRRSLGISGKHRSRELGIDEGTYLKLEADAYRKFDPRIMGLVKLLQKRFKLSDN
jgi:hypothetical protein